MRPWLIAAAVAAFLGSVLPAAARPAQAESPFVLTEAMIPMRDGVKLHTVILRLRGQGGSLPILFSRTPYGADTDPPTSVPRSWMALVRDGYIFVEQDMRGRWQSEGGPFTLSTEIRTGKGATDESTDAWDSIDWLVEACAAEQRQGGDVGASPIPARRGDRAGASASRAQGR